MKCIDCPYYDEDGEHLCTLDPLDECPFDDWGDDE